MFKALKKKNSEYSVNERRFTSITTFLIFAIFGYAILRNAELFQSPSVYPYIVGILIGITLGFVGYRYPKVINIVVFGLPLMFLGS